MAVPSEIKREKIVLTLQHIRQRLLTRPTDMMLVSETMVHLLDTLIVERMSGEPTCD